MAKRSRRGLSKKGLVGLTKQREPVFNAKGEATGSKLSRDENGNIIWLYNGGKYPTLRTVVTKHRIDLLGLDL